MLRHITRCVVVAIETKQALLRTLPKKNARDAGTRMGTGGAEQCVLIDFRNFRYFLSHYSAHTRNQRITASSVFAGTSSRCCFQLCIVYS